MAVPTKKMGFYVAYVSKKSLEEHPELEAACAGVRPHMSLLVLEHDERLVSDTTFMFACTKDLKPFTERVIGASTLPKRDGTHVTVLDMHPDRPWCTQGQLTDKPLLRTYHDHGCDVYDTNMHFHVTVQGMTVEKAHIYKDTLLTFDSFDFSWRDVPTAGLVANSAEADESA
jgi:hypothetical protein